MIYEKIEKNSALPFSFTIHQSVSGNIPLHWHRSYEINFILFGQVSYLISGQKFFSTNGDLVFINSAAPHSASAPFNPKNLILTLQFSPDLLNKLVPDLSFLAFNEILIHKDKTLSASFNHLIEALLSTQRLNNLVVLEKFYSCLHNIIEKNGVDNIEQSCIDKNIQLVSKFMSFLEKNYASELSIAEVAKYFSLSESYFRLLFTKYLGLPPKEYIQQIRLWHAYSMLVETNNSIQYISDTTGFKNVKSFSKYFKSHYDATPLQYKKRYLAQQKSIHKISVS